MVKSTIYQKQKKSYPNTQRKLKENADVTDNSATQRLMDESFIAQAIWECLKNNDPEGVVEIIQIHLDVVNKVKALKENDLSRATLYKALKGKNPTIRTLSKMVNCAI